MLPKNDSALDILVSAFKESGGETVDLVIDHGELPGVTPEMMRWWGIKMNDPVRYKMWHPEDHISHRLETLPDEGKGTVNILYAEEKIGEFSASVLRIRQENADSLPITRIYKHAVGGIMLTPDNKPMGAICHQFAETPSGMKMHSTFRFPARTPQRFINAMREHSKTEMGNLPKFLPEIYERDSGNK